MKTSQWSCMRGFAVLLQTVQFKKKKNGCRGVGPLLEMGEAGWHTYLDNVWSVRKKFCGAILSELV